MVSNIEIPAQKNIKSTNYGKSFRLLKEWDILYFKSGELSNKDIIVCTFIKIYE